MDLKTCHQDNVTCVAEGMNIKNEYLDRSPSRGERVVPNTPPTISATNGLFSGISAAKRLRIDGDWLATTHQNVGCKIPPHPSSHSSAQTAGPSCSSSNASVYQGNGYPTAVITPNNYAQYDSKKSVREEMISQSAYSINMSTDQNKKKTHSRQQEELCLVCGDRASGYHYNALTCEGCKGFFRRSITKNAVYQCKYGNECEIDMYMRRKCQECRLKKCLRVGMRPECVVPSEQCEKKKQTKEETMRKKNEWNGTTDALKVEVKSEDSSPGTAAFTKTVSPEHEELIHSLVYFQEQYEQPAPDDLERVLKDVREAHEVGDMKFRQITEMTILTVQLIVEFAKSLPGFDKLQREDQITLLKACSSEVMMLRMARKYDSNTDSIVFANNEPYTKDSYNMAGMGETIEDLLRFCRQMCAMKVDNAEYALLTAIVIFSTRPCLLESWKVEKIQEIYIETLKAYVETRIRPNSLTIFARLLSVLTELRTLGNRNSEMCFALKLKSKALPPFLSEIWDIAP